MELDSQTEEAQVAMGIEIWDNSRRAKNLIQIFWVVIGLTVVGIVSSYFELDLLERLEAGEEIDNAVLLANDSRQMVIGLIESVMRIISIVVFLCWFRRAYGNLHRLGINYLTYGESATIWTWFVPLLSWFLPVKIMNEIWNETQEKLKEFNTSYVVKSGGILIGTWWLLFIVTNVVAQFSLRGAFSVETVEQSANVSKSILFSSALEIPEALLVIAIVSQLFKMETALAEEVTKQGGEVVYK
ncbi:DUF4328 domain-containing protein [Wenyingzhuangia sp. IMCC45574]